jgi:hypothetical protein
LTKALVDLADGGLMHYEVAQVLDAAILAHKSMAISGDHAAKPTTGLSVTRMY